MESTSCPGNTVIPLPLGFLISENRPQEWGRLGQGEGGMEFRLDYSKVAFMSKTILLFLLLSIVQSYHCLMASSLSLFLSLTQAHSADMLEFY